MARLRFNRGASSHLIDRRNSMPSVPIEKRPYAAPFSDWVQLRGRNSVNQKLAAPLREIAIRLDQIERWQKGERRRLFEYVDDAPEVAENAQEMLGLIYGEVLLRESVGELPNVEEYSDRFPELADQIRHWFAMHCAGCVRRQRKRTGKPSILSANSDNGDWNFEANSRRAARARVPNRMQRSFQTVWSSGRLSLSQAPRHWKVTHWSEGWVAAGLAKYGRQPAPADFHKPSNSCR